MPRFRYASNRFDDDDNPAGGHVFGCGFTICWQDGPRGEGATPEAVLDAVRNRLAFFQQDSDLACAETAEAIAGIYIALDALDRRTRDREKRGVEGRNEA